MRKVLLVILSVSCIAYSALSAASDVDLHGFLDFRAGVRSQEDSNEEDISLGEVRLQLETERAGDLSSLLVRADLLYDDVTGEDDLDLEAGTGWIDLREVSLLISPLDLVDMKIGRQILTWGTGDLLFINDMFPKDWQAFFIGRDEEYLKAPSDALFVSMFPQFASIDIVYTPRFDADRYVRGDRISYWNPMLGSTAGRNAVIDPSLPDEWFNDHEVAVRLYRNVAGYEAAVYGYYGFWKNPEGINSETMAAYFPELSVYGASIRGALGEGLLNIEAGYYDSREDNDGTNPFVPNDEIRALIGYEQELARNLSMGMQYYVEHMLDYTQYKGAISEGMSSADRNRHLITLRLTRRAMNQNLVLSLFVYYSPSDEDTYSRLATSYKVSDAWLLTAGANLFDGENSHTFFGQFKDNSNLYAGSRYSF